MIELPIKSKFLVFESYPNDDKISIFNKKQKEYVGFIQNLKFFPSRSTIWSERDLKDILKAITYLKQIQKTKEQVK